MNLTTVTSEGNLIPAEILDAIAAGEAAGQKPADFGLDSARRLTDEIAAVWTEVRDYWRAFGHRLRRPGAGESATTITREHWVVPMLRALGYDRLTYQPQAAVANNRTYAISHRAGTGEDAPPVHIVGFPAQPGQGTLDERPASGRPRLSPHGLVQEYLNATDEHLWGITTNGAQLRLLRDSSRTSRPTYLEFDLQGMMDGEQFAEFALFYRVLHRTRLPAPGQDPATCLLERYHQEALAAGGRVREKLREGVQRALETLGGGLLAHPRNEALRAAWSAGRLTSAEYYRQLLRLVYRLLFLMVAEERQLIGAEADQAVYRDYYSLARLRRLAETPASGLERYDDLWLSLLALFRALQDDTGAAPLHVAALDGDLFGAGALPDLMATHLDNRSLLGAIYALSVYRDEAGKGQRRVNYSALDVEELGSVYESLLDLRPVIEAGADGLHFRFAQGTDRKTTGSYYTRPELVRELIKSALEPVLAGRLRAAGEDKDAAERAILGMTVCDPACGSGHFLLAAARRLGRELATVRTGEAQPGPEPFRRAVRDVIGHCIYGVDANPLAVDLCKLALWTEGYNKDMPLNFLDHHIKWGNSLVGATRALVEGGIPDGAYDPVTGDDKPTASALKKRNKQERESYLKAGVFQQSLPFGASTPARDPQAVLVAGARALEAAPDGSVAAYHAKADAYTRWRLDAHDQQTFYNLWTAAFFLPLTRDNAHIPTTKTVIEFSRRPSAADGQMVATANALAQGLGFFHWDLEFPVVFNQGGFDVVLGNPPWERIKLQEEEHWADDQYIAGAPNKAVREKRITEYRAGTSAQRARVDQFDLAKHSAEAESKFSRDSERFPLAGVGDVNTFALFAELSRHLISPMGRAGIIVPLGIATNDQLSSFFGDIIANKSLVSLTGFENEAFIFPAVANVVRFCAFVMSGTSVEQKYSEFAFYIRYFPQLTERDRFFYLTQKDLELLNPNTRTCTAFRSRQDAELAKTIYTHVPILSDERRGYSPWGVSFLAMFHMANDSHLFLEDGREDALPLYEAKFMTNFDHRFGSYDLVGLLPGKGGRGLPDMPLERHEDPNYDITPRYWVPTLEVRKRLANWRFQWLIGFRSVARSVDERVSIFSLLPYSGVSGKLPLLFLNNLPTVAHSLCFLANANSLILDYLARQKITGADLSLFIVKQLPVLPPDAFGPDGVAYLSERVLELVYTAWDIKAFADDVWAELDAAGRDRVRARWAAGHGTPPPAGDAAPPPFRWDDARRAQIRAEIDARIARLYGLTRDELRYILDPADVHGPDFPGETFRVLKEKEIKHYGEYRTRRLVLAAWDAAEAPHAGAAPRHPATQDGSGAGPPAAPAEAPRTGAGSGPPGWHPGDRVRHAALGEGRVTAVAPRDGDVEITVQFQTGGPRRLLASLARLERI